MVKLIDVKILELYQNVYLFFIKDSLVFLLYLIQPALLHRDCAMLNEHPTIAPCQKVVIFFFLQFLASTS